MLDARSWALDDHRAAVLLNHTIHRIVEQPSAIGIE